MVNPNKQRGRKRVGNQDAVVANNDADDDDDDLRTDSRFGSQFLAGTRERTDIGIVRIVDLDIERRLSTVPRSLDESSGFPFGQRVHWGKYSVQLW